MLTGIVLLTRRSSRRGEAAAALRGADWPRGLAVPLCSTIFNVTINGGQRIKRRGQVLTCAFAGLCYEAWYELSAEEFHRCFLSHILPQFRRIRDYGFLVNSQR
jgi:hypothetical protein